MKTDQYLYRTILVILLSLIVITFQYINFFKTFTEHFYVVDLDRTRPTDGTGRRATAAMASTSAFHFHFFWGVKYVSNVRDIYSSYKFFLPFMAGGALGPTAFMSGGVVGKLRERTDHFGGEHELDSTDTEASLVVGRREIHGGCTWPDGVHVAA